MTKRRGEVKTMDQKSVACIAAHKTHTMIYCFVSYSHFRTQCILSEEKSMM